MLLTFLKRPFGYLRQIWFLWGLCLLLNIITFLLVYFKMRPSGKTLALRYNVITGVEWYGEGKNLYLIPLVALVICLVNFILYKTFKKSGNFFSFLTVVVSLSVELMLLLAVLLLAKVN